MRKLLLSLLFLLSLTMQATTAPIFSQSFTEPFDDGWLFYLGNEESAKNVDFIDTSWRKLTLPHDWSVEFAPSEQEPSGNDGGYLPTGIGWYRKHFHLPALQSQSLFLYFEGIYERSTVYVNGQEVGGRPYGYSSFFVDISKAVRKGDNVVAVRVDNSNQKNSRWYTGSGIYRHVWLVSQPLVAIDNWGTVVTTPDLHTVVVSTTLVNRTDAAADATLSTTIDGREQRVTQNIPAHASACVQQTFHIDNPRPWSPSQPNLYTAEQQLGNQNVSTTFGIRTVEYTAERGLLLNGEPILLNGGCIHHDNGILGAAAFDRAEERKVLLMKQAGFNAVRTSHNPPSPAFLDACDRLGLLVIDEAFDGWREEKNTHDYHEWFDAWYERDIEAMVSRDRNHPSIFCWSIGNEVIERKKIEVVTTAHHLVQAIHRFDTTRPITSALAAWDSDWEIYDPLAAEHDIVGYNYMIHKHPTDHQRVPSRVMMQTESFPRDAFRNWATTHDNAYIVGDFVWTAIDYIGESGIGRYWYDGDPAGEHWERPLWPWHAAYCGDIDLIGQRKPISYYRDMLWNGDAKTEAFIAVREPDGYLGTGIKAGLWGVHPTWQSWTWPGWEGRPIEVEVYSKAPSVSLYLKPDGKPEQLVGTLPTTRNEQYKATFTLPYQPGTLRVGTTTLTTASKPARLRLTADRTTLSADGQDLSYITVEILDEMGRFCPLADAELTFSINGKAATLQATGSADIKDTTSYTAHQRKAWKGRALAVVRSTDRRGKATLTVSAPGMKKASLTIAVR